MTKKKKAISFPSKDSLFDVGFKSLMAHLAIPDADSSTPLVNSYTRLGIPITIYNMLLALLGTATTANTWLYVYPLQKNKATRTGTLTGQKNTLKKKILALVRAQRLVQKDTEKATPGTLTETDKQCFFLPVPNPHTNTIVTLRTSHPIPVLTISHIGYLTHTIDMRDPESPKSAGLPEGTILLQIKRYVGTVAPTDPSQYSDLLFSGKFRNPSTFTSASNKQSAWYIGRYIGPTGSVSDWSAPVNQAVAYTQ